ncbi:hypothetical protein [Dokdonella sp.]|uniref:hypothetical protein n=1 Tax=Dokdonella sp. TaxID=2291710 RepID=UPI003527F5FC
MVFNPMLRVALATGTALAFSVCAWAAPSPGERAQESSSNMYQSISLQPTAADALRRKVLIQCGIDPNRYVLPWYFHFEYGRALLEAGDAQRAIVELSQSIELKPESQPRKRTYGMWYLDYLPYFQLAEAHAMLHNWPCAENAMQLSRSMGEINSGRIESQRVRALQKDIDSHSADVGACNLRDALDPVASQAWIGG